MRVIGLCVACLPVVLLVRKAAAEQALLLTFAILLAAVAGVIALAAPAVEEFRALFLRGGIEEMYVDVLLKTVAAVLVTRLGSDLCRDGGSAALAGAVEMAGSASSLIIALPLLREVTDLMLGYFT